MKQPKKSPAKAKPPKDARTQGERFAQFAREHGADEDVLDKALGDIAPTKRAKAED